MVSGCRHKKEAPRRVPLGIPDNSVRLEVELRRQLGLTSWRCTGDHTCRTIRQSVRVEEGLDGAAYGAAGVVEVGVVEDVVALHTNLEAHGAVSTEVEVLGDDQVGVDAARAVVPVAADGTELTERSPGKAGTLGHEPPGAVRSGNKGSRVSANEGAGLVGLIGAGIEAPRRRAPERVRGTSTVRDIEREARSENRDTAHLPA